MTARLRPRKSRLTPAPACARDPEYESRHAPPIHPASMPHPKFAGISPLALLVALLPLAPFARADPRFTVTVTPNHHVVVAEAGTVRGRFEFAHDASSAARRNETYKPFLHLFDETGRTPITKGPGGEYTHHRGIFIGWMKILHDGKTYDRWTMQGGEQIVLADPEWTSGPASASIAATIAWNDGAGRPLLRERRELVFHRAPAPAHVVVDVTSHLESAQGELRLDGDPEHGGVHFRAASEVDRKNVLYTFPGAGAVARRLRDPAWIAMTFPLGERTFSVVQINHPANPKDSRVSAYRDYARMGYFPTTVLRPGERVTVSYRFVACAGPVPAADMIQDLANRFTGHADAPPAELTVRAAEVPPPPSPRKK